MSEQNLYNWLLLALTPNIGPVSFLKLLKHFQSIENVFLASIDELSQVVSQKAACLIKEKHSQTSVDETLLWQTNKDCSLLTLLDEDYPTELTNAAVTPPLLFLRGQRSLLPKRKFSIVGSRHPTPQGIQNATTFAQNLAQKGMVIVSGLAAGIDKAAHQGAINASGETIAIIGTGIDRVYPSSNKEIAHQLTERGLIISEFPLGTKPKPSNFPRRNRLIAALGEGTLVVEATTESGSLITARLAGQMNKEVMAIPGSIHNVQSKGCHKLIKEGAKLVESLEDIFSELPPLDVNSHTEHDFLLSSPSKDSEPSPKTTSNLLDAMGFDPIHPDVLAQKLNIQTPLLYEELLTLELDGIIKATSGGRFQRLF